MRCPESGSPRFGGIFMKQKKMLAACLAALLLAGCGSAKAPDAAPAPQQAAAAAGPAENAAGTDAAEDGVTAADYFRFLKEEFAQWEAEAKEKSYLLPYKPAATEPVELEVCEGDFIEKLSWNMDLYGTISAVVEDFDADGGLEMLTVGINDVAIMNTNFKRLFYEDGADYDSSNRCFELGLRYYDEKDGAVTCVDSNCIAFSVLPMDGWGHLLVGMEKLEDRYELYTYVYSENMSTYGPNYLEVIDVPGNMPKYISAISEWGLSEAEANELLYRDEVWDIASTTLFDTWQTIKKVDGAQSNLDPAEEAYRDALGSGLLCFVNVAYPEWGGKKVVYTMTDYTGFRQNLDSEGAGWVPIDIPQGGEREAPETPAGLDGVVADIEAAAGVTFAGKGTEEEDGILKTTLATDDNRLRISWDTAQNIPVSVGWYANDSNTTQEWFTVKDAILSHPVFGWQAGAADMLKGAVSWNDYAGNITIGDYSCGIVNAVGASMNIVRE